MGERGPKAAPRALKVVRGDRKSRVNDKEPPAKLPPEVPKPPAGMSAAARLVWERHAEDLWKAGLFSVRDGEEFAVWCEAVAFERKAARALQRAILVPGWAGKKSIRAHPAWRIWRDSTQVIRAFGAEFGMSPAARQGLIVEDAQTSDEARKVLS